MSRNLVLSALFATVAASAHAQAVDGPGPGRVDFGNDRQADLKKRFGALINAAPSEIAFTSSTSDGENIVVMGLDLAKKKGNIVIDELHFTTSLYMYKELEKQGVAVLLDDRAGKVSPGVKFKDAELIGVPTILVVGKGLAEGVVELKDRRSGDRREVPVADVVAAAVAEVGGAEA